MSDRPVLTITEHDHCPECGDPLCYHDKVKVFPEDGPAGTYKYRYHCTGDVSGRHSVDGGVS